MNRPEARNALDLPMVEALHDALGTLEGDASIAALVVTGAGDKAFVAGADIAEMQAMSGVQARAFSRRGLRAFRRLETLAIPTIALVNGYCLGGGCELAMSCDWILASDTAVFGQPEVTLGIAPGIGGTQRLSRLIGRARAMELTVTGRQVKADEALAWGLVNHVFGADELEEQGLAVARTIAGRPPIAVQLIKEAVQRGQDMDLDNACAFESEIFGLCFSTADQKEGMAAFLEKRPATFKGE